MGDEHRYILPDKQDREAYAVGEDCRGPFGRGKREHSMQEVQGPTTAWRKQKYEYQGNWQAVAPAVMKCRGVSSLVTNILLKYIQAECEQLCSRSRKCMLRMSSPDDLESFSWNSLVDELKQKAPLLFAVLTAAGAPPCPSNVCIHLQNLLVKTVMHILRHQFICRFRHFISQISRAGAAWLHLGLSRWPVAMSSTSTWRLSLSLSLKVREIFNCQHYSHLFDSFVFHMSNLFFFPAYFLPLLLASPTHSEPAERECHCCEFFRWHSFLLLPGHSSPTNPSHPRRVPSGSSSKHQEAKWLSCMGQVQCKLDPASAEHIGDSF